MPIILVALRSDPYNYRVDCIHNPIKIRVIISQRPKSSGASWSRQFFTEKTDWIVCEPCFKTKHISLMIGQINRISAFDWSKLSAQSSPGVQTPRLRAGPHPGYRRLGSELLYFGRLHIGEDLPETTFYFWCATALELESTREKKKKIRGGLRHNTVMLTLRLCSFVLLVLGFQKAAAAGNRPLSLECAWLHFNNWLNFKFELATTRAVVE